MADINLSELDTAKVLQTEEFLKTMLAEQFPNLDLQPTRVLREILIRPEALLRTQDRAEIEKLRLSNSLLAIRLNPALADAAGVDAVLSNFLILRDAGAVATGQVLIIIVNKLTTPIDFGTTFTSDGLVFTVSRAFVGVTTAASVLDPNTQRLITARGDGTFSFIVDVKATRPGEQYRLRRDTQLTVDPAPAGLIEAVAAQDFTGGRNPQTNAELVELVRVAISPRMFSGRVQIEALFRSVVPSLAAISVTGAGDAEMLRDKHNIMGISTLGKSDCWVRTQVCPESRTLIRTATLINAADKLWQLTVMRDDFPGFYEIQSVLPLGTANVTLATTCPDGTVEANSLAFDETRGLDLSVEPGGFVPDVVGMIEGAYSRYQTAVVRFTDPTQDTAATTRDYQVFVLGMPDIKTLQDLATDPGMRNRCADYLVKAAVPAFVTVSLKVLYTDRADVPDAALIRQSVADRVNGINFDLGRLPVSLIYDAVYDVVGRRGVAVAAPVDVLVRLRKPAGDIMTVRTAADVILPDLPKEGVTPRTVIFHLSPQDVDAAVEKVPVLPI